MKKTLFLTALCAATIALTVACDEDDPIRPDKDEQEIPADEQGDPGNNQGNQGNQNTQVNYPDCFVYYPGAQFIYKRTSGKTSSKFTWTVTDYDEQTQTATIQTKEQDSEPGELKIRRGSNGMIEIAKNGFFEPVVNSNGEVKYLFNYKPSIPSGIYGSLDDKVSVSTVSVPGGKSSAGFTVSASYQPYTGFHDSYLWDWQISETWCQECGFVRESSYWSNGKEYPISSSRSSAEIIAYDIPMPDGTRRTYIPDGCETYDVTDLYCTYFHHPASSQRYDDMTFYWNDKKNRNVMRYILNAIWYDNENGWLCAPIVPDMSSRREYLGWFLGTPSSGKAIGGTRDGESFDCEGSYLTTMKSNVYFDEGFYVFCVFVENTVYTAGPTDDTEIVGIYVDYNAGITSSVRVQLLDDGTVDYYTPSGVSTRADASSGAFTPTKPDPSMLIGPIRKLK